MRYRMNNPGVIQETLDGEAVIVNLLSGTYYSLDRAGGVIWNLLISGMSSEDILSQLESIFATDRATLAAAVGELTATLVQEELIVPLKEGTALADIAPAGVNVPASERLPFEKPVLHRYTDMQELLLLDPIHEVDERGWPHTNTPDSADQ